MSTEKIYSVYCHTCPNGMQYFGMSKNVKNRWMPSSYKGCSLEPYIEQFGWDAITHEVLYSDLTRDEALKLEDSLIVEARNNGTCINMFRSGHYHQTDEYKDAEKARYEANKEDIKARAKARYKANPEKENARCKAYREAHKEEEKVRGKAYREAHKEDIIVKKKAYYEAHKEDRAAYNKAYYEAKKDEINARRREQRKRKKGGGSEPEPLF